MRIFGNPGRHRRQRSHHYTAGRAFVLLGVLAILTLVSACDGAGSTAGNTPTVTVSPPTAQPVSPTSTPIPATPTPKPATPTPKPPPPTPKPATPTPAPHTGVNNNPWGYDFNKGALINNPPAEFCDYFNCISSFSDGKGYVVQCVNGQYSKSGGRKGVCSKQGGFKRNLYAH